MPLGRADHLPPKLTSHAPKGEVEERGMAFYTTVLKQLATYVDGPAILRDASIR